MALCVITRAGCDFESEIGPSTSTCRSTDEQSLSRQTTHAVHDSDWFRGYWFGWWLFVIVLDPWLLVGEGIIVAAGVSFLLYP